MKTNFKVLCLFVLGVIFMLSVMGCGGDVAGEATGDEKCSEKLLITGLAEDAEIRLEELKELASVASKASRVNRAGEEEIFDVTGVLLEDVLQTFLNKSQQDFQAIRLVAGDGYSIEVPGEIIRSREIVLAYEINGKPLEEEQRPLRAIIPDERAMYWVFNLIEIELMQEVTKAEINRVIILETAVSVIEQRDYPFNEKVYQAIRIKELMDRFAKDSTADNVFIKAADGLDKNERRNTFVGEGYLKIKEACLFSKATT